jgi:hypothetical protein
VGLIIGGTVYSTVAVIGGAASAGIGLIVAGVIAGVMGAVKVLLWTRKGEADKFQK